MSASRSEASRIKRRSGGVEPRHASRSPPAGAEALVVRRGSPMLLVAAHAALAGRGDAQRRLRGAFRRRRQDEIGRRDQREPRCADRSDRSAGRRAASDIGRRSAHWAGAGRRSPDRAHGRSGRDSSPRPAGSGPDRRRGDWRATTATSPVSSGWRRLSSACALELGQFVEEQHAIMGERDLARPRMGAAADQRRHRGRMMRRAKRPPVGELAARELARDRMDHRHFEQLARRQRRQDRGQARRQHRLAGARAGRSSADCGRPRRRSPAPAWRSPGP